MKLKKSLKNKVILSDRHCEHLCVIGMKHYKPEDEQHYTVPIYANNKVHESDKTHQIEIFNFCPRCGQELNIETKLEITTTLNFKEHK